MTYRAPTRDQGFILNEVLNIGAYADIARFADASADTVDQVLVEAGRFCEDVLAPLNSVGDKQGCRWSTNNVVTTPDGFKAAYGAMVEAGWQSLAGDPTFGGQGLPETVDLAVGELLSGSNMAFAMYPGLTRGAYAAIHNAGSPDQKAMYLPKMGAGVWSGTMNLTEPQCGTDLGLIRTRAVAADDGAYRIFGQKIWISAGEHDLAENIVHLVLARIEGAPAGVKGISLFIVPKFIPDPDGKPGVRNGVVCAGLEDKMGIHANATCVMVYEDAVGWLVGEPNHGLRQMFVMMNNARLAVGMQGVAIGGAAYQAAADFARERLQGRALSGAKNSDGPADPIIVHPDVRRMLMQSKALIEGGRALLLWTALQGDLEHASPDAVVRQKAGDYMALMTPVVKAYLTDVGFQVCSDAMQVHGGSGFTEHFPASQYLRDSRIAMIYEGANGVQALDLVGRKLAANGGRAVMSFFADVDALVAEADGDAALKPYAEGLGQAKACLQEATLWLMQNGLADPDNAGAASHDYLHIFGLTGLAYVWLLMVRTAEQAIVKAKVEACAAEPFYAAKLATGRVFIERILPDVFAHLAKVKASAASLMALPAEAF